MSAVKLEDARRVISAAEKKAKEIGQPMNIAVVPTKAETSSRTFGWTTRGLAASISR